MELDQIKQKVIESGVSENAFYEKVDEYVNLHPMFKSNKQLAYTVAANDLGIEIKASGRRSTITEDQIQDDKEFLNISDIDKTDLRVVNMRGYIIRAPQSESEIKQAGKNNSDVIYLSMVDGTGGVLLSCYKPEMFENIFDEKLQFLDPIILKNVLITIRSSDGAKFLGITERTSLEFASPIGFGLGELYASPVAEITDQYSTVMAVLSQIDISTYVGCPTCRSGGFEFDAGEESYCASDNCKTDRLLEELSIPNVGFMDRSGSIYCGISRWADINLDEFEIGQMVYASINSWEKADEIRYSVSAMKNISEEAYGQKIESKSQEAYHADPEDFSELEKLFEFEYTDEYEDLGPSSTDQILSVYREVCEFYENVSPRDISSIMTRRFRRPVKIHKAFDEFLRQGIIKFDRVRKEISSLEKIN